MGFKTDIQKLSRECFEWNISGTDRAWPAIRLMVARTSPKTVVDKFKQWVREQAAVPVNPLETFVRAMESCPQSMEHHNDEIRVGR